MSRTVFGQGLAGALVLAFSLGLGGEVYGLHDCPRHHHAPAESSPAAPDAATLSPEPAAHESHSSESTPEGPCTCIGTCHASAASPHPGIAASATLPAAATGRAPVSAAADVLAPRRSPYLLPYANGPPASAI